MNLMPSALGIILQKFQHIGFGFLSFCSAFLVAHGNLVSVSLALFSLLFSDSSLTRKQQNNLSVATSSTALPKEEQSHTGGTVTSRQT